MATNCKQNLVKFSLDTNPCTNPFVVNRLERGQFHNKLKASSAKSNRHVLSGVQDFFLHKGYIDVL